MTRLWRHAWKVQIDDLDVSALDIEFKILSTIKASPNKCVLTVWNLNQDHRAQILKRNKPNSGSKLVGVPVQVEAGYQDDTAVLFSGDLRETTGQMDGTDRKTILSGDDGGRAYREARINTQFSKGTQIGAALSQVCQAMGIGLGNANDFTSSAQINGWGSTLPHTLTLSGNAATQLDRLLRSIQTNDGGRITWSIQRGALQLLKKGQPLNQSALRIAPDSGLIGSPEASIDATVSLGNPQQFAAGAKGKTVKAPKPKDPSIIKFRALLIPGLYPGRKILLDTAEYHGGYVVTEVEYEGQSWSDKWNANCVARVY